VRFGLDKERLTAICSSESVPLRPSGWPEVCERYLFDRHTELLEKRLVAVLGVGIVSER
jgi:hypothetical protein